MSEYSKTLKVKDRDKDENNKMMSFCIKNKKLLEKCKPIWTKIEDLKNIKLNALQILHSLDENFFETNEDK